MHHHDLQDTTYTRKISAFLMLCFVSLQSSIASAAYSIGAPTSGPWAKAGAFMQDLIDLLDGPGVLIVSFISIFAVVGLWMLAPKAQGVMGWALRVAIGSIIILNIGAWIVALRA